MLRTTSLLTFVALVASLPMAAQEISAEQRTAMAAVDALATRCPLLRRLALSGCERLTDAGLHAAASAQGLPALEELVRGRPELVESFASGRPLVSP